MNQEFKKSAQGTETRYVLETASSGATSSGSVAGVVGGVGKVQKRGNILAQEANKKKEAPKPRNFVAKNAKMGGAGKMQDKSKTIPRKEKHKKPVAEGIGGLGYDAQSLITKLRRDVEEKRLKPTPEAVLAAARELAGDMEFAPQLLVQQVLGKGVAEGFNGEYDDEAGMAHSNLLTTARAVMGLLKTIKDRDNLPEWGQEKIAKAEMMLVSVWDYLQSQKELGNDPQVDMEEGAGRPFRGVGGAFNRGDDERHDLDPTDWYFVKDGKMFAISVYPNQEREATARGYSRTRDEAKAKASQQGVAEGASDFVGDSIEALRSSVPGLKQQDFLDELYMYIENQYGQRAAEMMSNAGQADYDEWYDSYLDNPEQGMAEGSLNEDKGFDVVKSLVSAFNNSVSGDANIPLAAERPGSRVFTRSDGTRYRDHGNIRFYQGYIDPQDVDKWKATNPVEKFSDWLTSQPGVKPIGQVSGEFRSDAMRDAVAYKGLYFVLTPHGSVIWGSVSRFKNPNSVWRQQGPKQGEAEVDTYMESLAESLQEVLSEKAVSKKQQKFMGMVHAAQKGEKPASKEVAKVAKDMGKKDAKDFAATKHKGLPEKKKSKK